MNDLVGKTVRWTSQAGSYYKTKQGKVLAYVPHNESAKQLCPQLQDVRRSRFKFDYDCSAFDRYIIAVPRKSGGVDYYAPLAGNRFEVVDA